VRTNQVPTKVTSINSPSVLPRGIYLTLQATTARDSTRPQVDEHADFDSVKSSLTPPAPLCSTSLAGVRAHEAQARAALLHT
jgi:hypothetical protein